MLMFKVHTNIRNVEPVWNYSYHCYNYLKENNKHFIVKWYAPYIQCNTCARTTGIVICTLCTLH